MKRARARPAVSAWLLVVLLTGAAPPGMPAAEQGPLGWINSARRAAGVPALRADPVLAETAQAWAAVLAVSGSLSHRGADGSTVLDRYREQGGTDARVGEILGAGPSLSAVEKGWTASADHRALVLDAAWTHAGWAASRSGSAEVWVVLFSEKLVENLRLDRGGGSLEVTGTFTPREAARALLYVGLDPVEPAWWDPATRRFSFTVGAAGAAGYFRLGYVSAGGIFRLTNTFTLLPGRESPGAAGRFPIPARSP